ncbi:hypothetical protein [Paenibacillus sp. NPDC058071]|uniref:hypothetical protein n=1 Tax=Paenibacillus sp. NPDC058071 TaxID=3346326 RepID=UPI0036D8FC5B
MGKTLGLPLHRNDNFRDELAEAYRDIPSPVRSSNDVTAAVVSQLIGEKESFHSSRRESSSILRRNMFTRVAVMLCVFALVGGTAYAAYSEYRLSLHDKSGDNVLQVASTDIPERPIEERRILERVREGLKDGEQAVVYLGQRAMREQNGDVMPQAGSSYSIVVKPREFNSPEHMNDYLLARGIDVGLPLSNWKGWSLSLSELQNDTSNESSIERQWNFASDEQSGLEYKYAIGPSGTEPSDLRWFYSKQNEEMTLVVSLNIPVMPIFYDSHPSSDSILSIKGIDAYFYRAADGSDRSIQWSEKVAEGNYRMYTVFTHTADDDELRKFAEAVISNKQ